MLLIKIDTHKKGHLIFLLTVFICMGCKNKHRTWSVYKADAASSSYSELNEINKENIHQLKIAWIFDPDDALQGSGFEKMGSLSIKTFDVTSKMPHQRESLTR